jgi:hypothetical protein
MQTRFSKMKWVALFVGMLLMSGATGSTQAGCWWKSKCKSDDCPEEVQNCPMRKCKRCHGRGCSSCRCYKPFDPAYCDFRDTRVYSAQGYGVPVTVPLAPISRTFNYGWGIPTTRLSRAGGYAAFYPDQPYTQNGGSLPGGLYPMVYQPTDTTQTGIYYNYVPTWQPRRSW